MDVVHMSVFMLLYGLSTYKIVIINLEDRINKSSNISLTEYTSISLNHVLLEMSYYLPLLENRPFVPVGKGLLSLF